MTCIYLLRHGATSANREVPYRLQGRGSDRPLDEIGRAQSEAASRALAHVSLAAVYSSPLLRAIQTAEVIAGPRGLRIVAVPALIEGDVGRWEGRTWDEVARIDPELHAAFLADPGHVPYPEGESFADVGRRASPALLEIAARHRAQNVAVIGHNILNRAYLAPLLGLSMAQARGLRLSNAGISVVEVDDDGRSVVLTLNAALHLEGLH
jgi:broad specificity phosphatase PhoE